MGVTLAMIALEVSGHEIVLILLAGAMLYAALAMRERRPIRNSLLVLSLVPALFVAVEGGTELLTYDETYMVREVANLEKVTSRQWNFDNYRTSLAITGNIVSLIRTEFAQDDSQAKKLVKSVHWLLGVAILTGIFWTISQEWIPKNLFAEYFLIYFYSALLLPTNILSLKVANYDMLAMLLGIWGIICSLIGCEKVEQVPSISPNGVTERKSVRSFLREALWPDGGLTLFGVILTTLAAQEKQIAAPFLSLAVVLCVLMRIRRRGGIDWWMPVQIVICILSVSLTLALTYGVVASWHPAELPPFDLVGGWRSLLIHFHIVLRAIGVSEPTLMMAAGFALITIGLAPLLWWFERFSTSRLRAIIRIAFPLVLLVALIVGAVSFYKIKVFMDPAYPIPAGYYVPKGEEWNGETIHFLGRTHFEHLLRKTGNAYSILATSLPSVFGLAAILILGAVVLKKPSATKPSLLGFEIIALLSLGMPVVHVVTKTAVAVRYFDLWVFTQVLVLGLLGGQLLGALPRRHIRWLALTGFCLLLLLELLPFRPVVGAFWPFWADASRLEAARVVKTGRMLPVWSGWGEEAMIAGRWLRHQARSGQLPSRSFRLFSAEEGEWLQEDPSIVSYVISSAPYLSFTENDYYMINRPAVVLGVVNFVKDKKPIWTLEYRGVAQAWLYRGSDLEKH
jgi:hypothetical protein